MLRVFDSCGVIRPDPDVKAVRLLRQLFRVGKRIRVTCSDNRTRAAVADFVETDHACLGPSLDWNDPDFDPDAARELTFEDIILDRPPLLEGCDSTRPERGVLWSIQQVADILVNTLGFFNPDEWKPKHGPGAVSDQPFGKDKYLLDNWPDKLERFFPVADFGFSNFDNWVDSVRGSSRPFGGDRIFPSKLIAVPKELGKPRLIASEPTSHQWCQQIIKDFFYQRVRRTFISSFISFRDQTKNGDLALSASHDQSHATIDLSSASDRVACWHVERLFRRRPELLGALWASRTPYVRQTIHVGYPLHLAVRKYSTMGNATIFPVQSLFFLSVCLGTLLYSRGLQPTPRNIERLKRDRVRVFGDDIIVPSDCSELVVRTLVGLGLKVNPNKTFLSGYFRESCGVDAFKGHNVTPVSILDVPKRTSPGSIVSTVDVHNNLCEQGYMNTALWMQKAVEQVVSRRIPFVAHGSGAFGLSDRFGEAWTLKKRFNRHLHITEAYGLRTSVRSPRSLPEGSSGLLQFFTEASVVVTSGKSTIGYLTQRPKAKLGLGWAPVV